MAKDFYEILGVSKDATQKEIKAAYRKLSRKWHPDINPGNKDAESKFKEIVSAHEVLGNEKKRKLYDEFGEEGLQTGFDAEKAREYKQWSSPGQGAYGMGAQDFGRYHSYEDILGDIFSSDYNKGGFKHKQPSRGRDIEYDMTIDLISSLKGFETEISMQKMKKCVDCKGSGTDPKSSYTTCRICGGSGRVNVAKGPMEFTKECPHCQGNGKKGEDCQKCSGRGYVPGTEKIKVVVPAGVKEGSRVRVAGKGEPGPTDKQSGNLYLQIHIKPHPFLKRDGDNLYMEVPVTVREVMAGGTITVPTVDGKINMKVPPGSQSGQTLKLKGKGAYNAKTKQRGDLMVKLIVKVPKTEDKDALAAVEKLDKLYKEDVRAGIRL